jgi:NAD(P)H-dependent nitrite reductase small subunit
VAQLVTVARRSDIPEGTGKSIEAGGKRIAVFNISGEFHAIDDACLHRGGPLGEGEVEEAVVTCPWHLWQFDVTTGRCVQDQTMCTETYPVRLEGDEVQVEI